MATWAALVAEIYTLTKRPDLIAETDLALRAAVRTAHKSGHFWRDLVQVTISGLPVTAQVQEILISANTTRFRQAAKLTLADDETKELAPVTINDLLDADNYPRAGIYWGFGNLIKVRAVSPASSYILSYYQYPLVFPINQFNSWISEEYPDLLIAWAAAQVLATVGEKEIAERVEKLAGAAYQALKKDNLEILGR